MTVRVTARATGTQNTLTLRGKPPSQGRSCEAAQWGQGHDLQTRGSGLRASGLRAHPHARPRPSTHVAGSSPSFPWGQAGPVWELLPLPALHLAP